MDYDIFDNRSHEAFGLFRSPKEVIGLIESQILGHSEEDRGLYHVRTRDNLFYEVKVVDKGLKNGKWISEVFIDASGENSYNAVQEAKSKILERLGIKSDSERGAENLAA